MLNIPIAKVVDILAKAQDLDVEIVPMALQPEFALGEDETDAILAPLVDDPAYHELVDAVAALSADEIDALLALALIGRGDLTAEQWPEALARARRIPDADAVEHLVSAALLTDYLEEALDELGYSLEEIETGVP